VRFSDDPTLSATMAETPMVRLTRRRCCWSLLFLLATSAVLGLAVFLLYEPEERIGPANFHRLRPGTTRDEAHAILGRRTAAIAMLLSQAST
jgi:hypothetical protein